MPGPMDVSFPFSEDVDPSVQNTDLHLTNVTTNTTINSSDIIDIARNQCRIDGDRINLLARCTDEYVAIHLISPRSHYCLA